MGSFDRVEVLLSDTPSMTPNTPENRSKQKLHEANHLWFEPPDMGTPSLDSREQETGQTLFG